MTVGRDPGAQPERTRLAWRRTALTATVVAILSVRLFLETDPPLGPVLTALTALLWLAFLCGSQLRIRHLARARPLAWRPPYPALSVLVAWCFAVAAAVAIVALS